MFKTQDFRGFLKHPQLIVKFSLFPLLRGKKSTCILKKNRKIVEKKTVNQVSSKTPLLKSSKKKRKKDFDVHRTFRYLSMPCFSHL